MTEAVPVRLSGRVTQVGVRFSAHAVARYVERVRPTLTTEAAEAEILRVGRCGVVDLGAPRWLGRSRAFLYLTVGDVTFPLDADDDGQLVACTCLSRGMPTVGYIGRRSRRVSRGRLAA